MIELPPLPDAPNVQDLYPSDAEAEIRLYARDYGEACAKAAIEAAAIMLDAEHESRKHADNHAAFYARKVRALATA
jgi:hypothetical protein